MKKTFLLFALLSFAGFAAAQTVFEYDKKGNQIRRSRSAKISAEITVSGDTTIEKGAVVRLAASGGEAYFWNTGEVSPEIEVRPEATTCYFVTVRDVCKLEKNDSVEVKVMHTIAAPEIRETVRFEISPNPARVFSHLFFELPRPGKSQIRLINPAGDVLVFQEFSTQNLDQNFPLGHFPAGQYFWSLWFEGAVFTKPFTILP